MRVGDRFEHLRDGGVLHRGAARLRAAFAQDVLAAEFDRVDAELARDQVGVALIGPDELRNAEAAQRAGRRAVGVELVGIDLDILDVVGPRRGEAGFLRHARADIGIGAAVPEHLAGARDHLAILADAALDAERRRMLGDHVELLFHRQRDLDRPAHQHRQRRDQRFELDVDLGAEAAAEITAPSPARGSPASRTAARSRCARRTASGSRCGWSACCRRARRPTRTARTAGAGTAAS